MMSRALFRRRTNKYGSPLPKNRFFKAIHEFKNNNPDLFRDLKIGRYSWEEVFILFR